MKDRIVGSIAVIVTLSSFAAADQGPSKERVDAIWSAVDDRVGRQIDVWFHEGDFPKVIALLDLQISYSPHDYEVATNLGWMRENIEDWDGALAVYARYRKDNPQDKDATLPEAQYYFMKRNYSPIPSLLEPTLGRHPHPNIYRILAHTYERQNKMKDAVRVWTEYLRVNPSDGPAKVNLARDEKKLSASK